MQGRPSIFIHPLVHVSYRGFRNFADLCPVPRPVNTQKRRLVGGHISLTTVEIRPGEAASTPIHRISFFLSRGF